MILIKPAKPKKERRVPLVKYQNSKKREVSHFNKKGGGYTEIGPGNEKRVQGLGRDYCKLSKCGIASFP